MTWSLYLGGLDKGDKMTTIDLTKTVRDFAVELPEATRVFEKLGIDYCCGGDKTLQDACLASGVSLDKVVGLVEESRNESAGSNGSVNWNSAPLSDLAAYIVNKHHRFTREELSRIRELLVKVCSVHGENHAELHRLRIVFIGLQDELTSHMFKEEQILFPYIQNLELAITQGKPAPTPPFVTVRNPIRMMIAEHDDAGQALRALREATSNYQVPADGCMSFRALYQGLEEFEKDLHQHIHLENNIRFPRAEELEDHAGMSTHRRHESLIPLSREHHHGLLVCLRIHRGLEKHSADSHWLNERAEKVIRFFESDLRSHFTVEEQIVFPAMAEFEQAGAVLKQLIEEHGHIARLVQDLGRAEGIELSPLLREFAGLLEAHIRKEERVLFPCYERNIAPQEASRVKTQVMKSIGRAMKPKHPELLE